LGVFSAELRRDAGFVYLYQMPLYSRTSLIRELLDRTELLKANTQVFLRLTDDQLIYQPAPGKWSIAEIYRHLNLSLEHYIKPILSRIALAPEYPSDTYHSGLLGEWVYGKIMPRADGSVFRLKTLKIYCPDRLGEDYKEELSEFQRHCDALDDILRHVTTKDLRRLRVPFLAPGLSLQLGDLLRVLVAHGERHLLQAQRLMTAIA